MSKTSSDKIWHDVSGLNGEAHLKQDSEQFKIAIIGCGAAGVATLLALIESPPLKFNKKITITIFEKGPVFGPGFAYQCDSNELLMNMVSSTTSIFPNRRSDFWDWMLEKGFRLGSQQVLSKAGVSPDGYIPRQFFGLYLKSQLEYAISILENLGIGVDLIHSEVTDICVSGENKLSLIFDTSRSDYFNCVILCIGNTAPNDIFHLSDKSQYVNNPYPINRYSQLIKASDCVGIIGGQLTAADIAIVLANQGHKGPIIFFTRDLHFPLVRCPIGKYDLEYLTQKNLEILKCKHENGISIRQIMRLARKEFLLAGVKWSQLFKPSTIEYSLWLKSLLADGNKFLRWQNLAIATDGIIGDYWNALSEVQKSLFMNRFHRLWSAKRVPLPVHTTLKLYSLFRLGILRHYPCLREIDASIKNQFTALVSEAKEPTIPIKVHCDWVINASGPSRDIRTSDSILIRNLLKSKLILNNPNGGIMLDYESSLIKSTSNGRVNNFYAIGHLTSGTYYFVSSLDMVSLKAKDVVTHLNKSLRIAYGHQDQSNEVSSADEYVS